MGLEGLPVLTPRLRVRLQVGHFPPCLADLRVRCRRVCKAFGELLTDKAMLRIGFPVHVEGELYQCAKALLALAKCFLGACALCYVCRSADELDELSVPTENRMTRGMDVPNCSVGQ